MTESDFKKARDHGLVISKFLENKLIEYFTFIDAVSKTSPSYNTHNQYNNLVNEKPNIDNQSSIRNKDKVGLLRFELKSMAPEATRIPSYPTSPNLNN